LLIKKNYLIEGEILIVEMPFVTSWLRIWEDFIFKAIWTYAQHGFINV